jgi:hypothetical protein
MQSPSWLLRVAAVVCFALATVGVSSGVNLLALGLCHGHLLPDRHRAASGALDQFLGRPAGGLDDPDCATIRNPRATGTP